MVDVENEIAALQSSNPSITAAQLDAGFNSFYLDLLSNPAVAGLAVRPHWDTLNPNPPGAANAYYWNLVDDAFGQAAAWNAQNPSQRAEDDPTDRAAGVSVPAMAIESDSELRRVVSDAGGDASEHLR